MSDIPEKRKMSMPVIRMKDLLKSLGHAGNQIAAKDAEIARLQTIIRDAASAQPQPSKSDEEAIERLFWPHGHSLSDDEMDCLLSSLIKDRAGARADERAKTLDECEAMRDAAENVLIAYGMGWDMDGVIEKLRDAIAALRAT